MDGNPMTTTTAPRADWLERIAAEHLARAIRDPKLWAHRALALEKCSRQCTAAESHLYG